MHLRRPGRFLIVACFALVWLLSARLALAQNEIFLPTSLEQSDSTAVITFVPVTGGAVDKIRVQLPAGMTSAGVALKEMIAASKILKGVTVIDDPIAMRHRHTTPPLTAVRCQAAPLATRTPPVASVPSTATPPATKIPAVAAMR